MKAKLLLSLIASCVMFQVCEAKYSAEDYSIRERTNAAKALVERVIGDKASAFKVVVTGEQKDSCDYWSLYSKGKKIVLEGNDGVSVASALNHYLKEYCNCQVGWCGTNLDLPEQLPLPEEVVTKTSPHKYRYYLNYCTFNYTMSWWDEERWRQEIDLMALNGINMPLALTGQNTVWQRVYKRLGFTDEDMEKFFSGPTHFSWFWMGNLDGWGGPLPQSFIDRHESMQKFILDAERSLGMTPVLPAFTGHVPPTFCEKFPEAKVRKTSWVGFPEVSILDPDDSLFTVIGEMFMEEQTKLYGTDHLYSADTFNENIPPTNDPVYLGGMSDKVYKSMSNYDPEAMWIMQGWLFYYSGHFWKEPEIRALLGAVPDDKMMILDLWADRLPVWGRTEGYYGKPWIWCMLHNFGQNSTFNGDIANVAKGPAEAMKNPVAKNMQGIGLTMEGIEQTPMMYALMFENVWRDTPVNISEFLASWLRCRYGDYGVEAQKAWEILVGSVFEQSKSGGGHESVVTARPSMNVGGHRVSEHRTNNYIIPLNNAWDIMMGIAAEVSAEEATDGFRYDIVDITRQVLAEYANCLHTEMCNAYKSGDKESAMKMSSEFLELLDDMDKVLGTRSEFLLGRWIENAKSLATNEEEKVQYEYNARNLIALWGNKDCSIHDYACKHWSGLISGFYKGRWEQLFQMLGDDFRQEDFVAHIKTWEHEWEKGHEVYPAEPSGDEVAECLRVYEKYGKKVKH